MVTKTCYQCKNTRPEYEFRQGRGRYGTLCLDCNNANWRTWYAKNTSKILNDIRVRKQFRKGRDWNFDGTEVKWLNR